jgi:glycosyltransferase involved in cell wall biosynthesis
MRQSTLLHITTWFPHANDPQLGIFIKKHIALGFSFANNVVLAVIPSHNLETPVIIEQQSTDEFTLITVLYAENKLHKFLSLHTREKAIQLGIKQVKRLTSAPDSIICHVAEVSLYIAQKHFPNTPRYLIEHWSGFVNGNFEKIPFTVRKNIIKRINSCVKILVVSDQLKRVLIQLGVTAPIHIIHNIIEYKSIKKEWNNKFTFGVIADLNDSVKNISGILNAYLELCEENSNYLLLLVGNGKDKSRLLQHPVWQKFPKSIEYVGRLSNAEVLEFLPTIDTLIVNSYTETYSMITAEALLSGVPVIATKCGGPEQFIINAKNGLLIPLNEPSALLDALRYMLKNKAQFSFSDIHQTVETIVDSKQLQEDFKNLLSSQQ